MTAVVEGRASLPDLIPYGPDLIEERFCALRSAFASRGGGRSWPLDLRPGPDEMWTEVLALAQDASGLDAAMGALQAARQVRIPEVELAAPAALCGPAGR